MPLTAVHCSGSIDKLQWRFRQEEVIAVWKNKASDARRPNPELYGNRHRNKLCVILDSFELPSGKWKKGMTCATEMYATAPVGLVVWLCVHDYRWGGGRPTTKCSYVMGRVTLSKVMPKPRGSRTTSRYFRTEFVLIEDGPNHIEYH
jgi:hypothetical protein